MFDNAWIVVPSQQTALIADTPGLTGACFGLVRVWAQRVIEFPNETPLVRMTWLTGHVAEAIAYQREYAAIKHTAVANSVALGLREQRAVDAYGARIAMADAELLVVTDAQSQIVFHSLEHYSPQPTPTGGYAENRKWFFENEEGEIKANTVYFWDVAMNPPGANDMQLHACVSRHLTNMGGPGRFAFYDPNLGEMSIPCDDFDEFLKGWVIRYTEGLTAMFIDRLTLFPMRRAYPRPADAIPLIAAAWNSKWGLWRTKSAASIHAMARLQTLAGNPAQAAVLREAIRWYGGRIAADPGGTLATRHGAAPAAGSKLRSLLVARFATYSFF
ncbi:hypothetical protein C8P66_12124 [Humitalea rosea]|uniref:Uncharacterized protein n=1 Tax=Humitalea rosea TaxID=990373 RepID=A0A2W7IPJ2_9PROT|nr:hypothetical protein [Humitalea rosea]PZW41317.1 hypothetical protein C8P66_12124 [Humitalea rosea]